MADETCSSEALISFLLEISRGEDVQKSSSGKKECCKRFLSFFEDFDLREFLVELENLVEKHLQIVMDASKSYLVRTQRLVFVTGIKLGGLRILLWLFTTEYGKCRKFVAESENLLEQVYKSGCRLNSDESSSLGSDPGRRKPAPKRTRKPRNTPHYLEDNVIEEVMDEGLEQRLEDTVSIRQEEPEIENPPSEDMTMSDIANAPEEELHMTMPLELSDMECEEEVPLAEICDVGPSFQLQPLSETELAVTTRAPRRRKTIDRCIQLSEKILMKHMVESVKLSKTIEENRSEIFDLCSKLPSASELLRPGPSVERAQGMTEILTKWFKRPRLQRNIEAHIEAEQGAQIADESDEILHALLQTTDDPNGIPETRPMQDGRSVTSPARDGSESYDFAPFPLGAHSSGSSAGTEHELAAEAAPLGGFAFGSSSESNYEDHLDRVYALILRNANKFHRQDDFCLRYACLSEISQSVPREEFASLFKHMLLLCESDHLYIMQPSPTSNQVFLFPRGHASDDVA